MTDSENNDDSNSYGDSETNNYLDKYFKAKAKQ